ncbi:DinB family protein [Marinigracilibium pacificum]|uniref:DinB family protein n=1 Tax=Marinigracilibium pacificum TaxID=2729599 RepID=A0A848IW75_9BACT|nr:DinB family protein [Marinigracilibium pacificum]NMM48587.1 DinB family protein [Marinigracilibium pacificum]
MQDISINSTIIIHEATRNLIKKVWDSLTPEELSTIPKDHKNNILWNIGHCIVTQQLLIYALSNNEMTLPPSFIEKFRKGSSPANGEISESDIEIINENLMSQSAKLKEDYEKLLNSDFKEYETSYGVKLSNVNDAISFNNVHEALHLGIIMSLKKHI